MPKISIIVPVYNTQKYLKKCLDSLVNQTFREIEIIVVNDGSPDNSLEVIKQYEMADSRFVVLDFKNQGLSGARNSGIDVAQGEYIMFVDSDDWIDHATCEKAYNQAKSHDAQLVLFSYVSESSNLTRKKQLFNEDIIIFNKDSVFSDLFCGVLGLTGEKLRSPDKLDALVSAWGKLYKTEIIKNNNILNKDLRLIPSECQLFNLEFLYYVNKAVYFSDCLYHYRRNNETSLTKKYKKELFEKWLYWIDYVKDFLDKKNLNQSAFDAYYSRICFSIIPLTGNSLKQKNFIATYKEIKKILNNDYYKEAYHKLNYSFFPLHWYVYFKFAKWRFVLGVYLMSKIMRIIIELRKR